VSAPRSAPTRVTRRGFVALGGAGLLGGGLLGVGTAAAQGFSTNPISSPDQPAAGGEGPPSAASNVPMDPSAYKPVARPAKPGARPQLTAQQRDALEHTLKCQCPCTLDVFTCRTTDFSCGVSPAMHQDVMRLVDGGHSADDIIAAFTQAYGERVLMAPKKSGFNLAGYAMPFAALGGGAVLVGALMRRWSHRAAAVAAATRAEHAQRAAGNGHGAPGAADDATPDELAQLEAAVRGGDDR
jgi:cytochrome c-type biogenesis protein CcmH